MRWRGRRESTNIEDLRGAGGGSSSGGFGLPGGGFGMGRGGGGGGGGLRGIGILIAVMVVLWLLGINPLVLLEGAGFDTGSSGSQPGQTEQSGGNAGSSGRLAGNSTGVPGESGDGAPTTPDEMKRFVAVVLADTEDVWASIFRSANETYRNPTLVLFTGQVRSACGSASSASGPFYCPADSKVYLDMAFFSELARRFGAGGDFADAYVIAHEVGHHVQNQLGILPRVDALRRRATERDANALTVRLELQADCFAGVWAYHTDKKGDLEPGDIDEALNAAHQIGDDTLQRRAQGYVVPDSFTHGTAVQRARWFKAGFNSGKIAACDTFNADQL